MEHFFRHESGRLVSRLARIFSLRNLDFVEDVVQSALVEALRSWRINGVPRNPGGWIRQVARNRILDQLRHAKMADRHAEALARLPPEAVLPEFDDDDLADDQLRMIFACCHPALAYEDQIALTLRTLCGFHNAEIARALLVGEAAIAKRLSRAKQALVDAGVELAVPSGSELDSRLATVQRVLYLFFNEGYLSTLGERAVRQELCEEAVRLALILADHASCGTPATQALAALMLFHAARLDARLDDAGRILLLDEQDRTKWDAELIAMGKSMLDRASRGERISAYHLEAGIALEHCTAANIAGTNWDMILKLYDALLKANPSPVYSLNRAIALAHLQGPQAGIDALRDAELQRSLGEYHLLDATLGELHIRKHEWVKAKQHLEAAMAKTRSDADRLLLERKLARCHG